MSANLLALGAVALWGSLAALGVALSHVPPFLLTGLSLLIGSLIALPLSRFDWRRWRVPPATLALGVYGLFGFHFLLFIALRHAPPVQANLVNYLWPLGIVVMAPLFLPGTTLTGRHILAALLGFGGAALAILGRSGTADAIWAWGYLPAAGPAFIWSSYSLLTKRVAPFPTAAIGSFALVSGLLSLLCHALMEPAVSLTTQDWVTSATRWKVRPKRVDEIFRILTRASSLSTDTTPDHLAMAARLPASAAKCTWSPALPRRARL